MSHWINNFDSIYHRKPLPFGDALERYVGDAVDSAPGSRVIEDLTAQHNALVRVVKEIGSTLGAAQQAQVAKALGMRAAPDGD